MSTSPTGSCFLYRSFQVLLFDKSANLEGLCTIPANTADSAKVKSSTFLENMFVLLPDSVGSLT